MRHDLRILPHRRPAPTADMLKSNAALDLRQQQIEKPCVYYLPHGVYIAEAGRKVIFLDLNRDKYQAVDRANFVSLTSFLAGRNDAGSTTPLAQQERMLHSLAERGLLTDDERSGREVQQVTARPPRANLHPDRNASPAWQRPFLLGKLLHAARTYDRELAAAPLKDCIERIRSAKATCRVTHELPRALPYLLHARFYHPADLVCLRDSFLLMRILLSRGVAADWVFGVQAEPFSAHCWVQVGDVVINDNVDHVVRFTPILVV